MNLLIKPVIKLFIKPFIKPGKWQFNQLNYFSVILICCLCLIIVSCSKEIQSPEQQINNYVDKGKQLAESRDAAGLKQLISKNYQDNKQRNRLALVQLATAYFWRHKNIHVYTQIKDLRFEQQNMAKLQLFVALADLPILSADSLFDLRARLFRFDLALILEEEQWRVNELDWRPATKEDFFDN